MPPCSLFLIIKKKSRGPGNVDPKVECLPSIHEALSFLVWKKLSILVSLQSQNSGGGCKRIKSQGNCQLPSECEASLSSVRSCRNINIYIHSMLILNTMQNKEIHNIPYTNNQNNLTRNYPLCKNIL